MGNQNQTDAWQGCSDNPLENCTQQQAIEIYDNLVADLNFTAEECVSQPYVANMVEVGEKVTGPNGEVAEPAPRAVPKDPWTVKIGPHELADAIRTGGPETQFTWWISIGLWSGKGEDKVFTPSAHYPLAMCSAAGTSLQEINPGGGHVEGTLPFEVVNAPVYPITPQPNA